MGRLSNGDYQLPLPDVAPGTTIESVWANTTMNDIETALTDSLDRQGRGGMLAPLKFNDGAVGAPGMSWTAEPTSGFYRAALGDMRASVLATDVMRWNTSGAQIWNGSAWEAIITANSGGVVPDGVADNQTLVWNQPGSNWEVTSVLQTEATGISVQGNISVTGTVDGVNVSTFETSYNNHVADANIHYADAPNDANQYVRFQNGWQALAPFGEIIPSGTVDGQTLRWEQSTTEWLATSDMVVSDAGDVGIGIAAPRRKLDVTGDLLVENSVFGSLDDFNGALGLYSDNSSTVGSGIVCDGDGDPGNSGGIRMVTGGFNERIRVTGTGLVGVGTQTPNASSAIDINGDIYTENVPLIANAKRFEVVSTLPGTTVAGTIYLLTGP